MISWLVTQRLWEPLYKHEVLSPDNLARMFAALVEGARVAYCPHQLAKPAKHGTQFPTRGPCGYLTFGTGRTLNSLTRGWRKKRFAEQLPALEREYLHDPEADGGRYVQNLVMVPNIEELCCPEYDKCMANWEELTRLRPKNDDSYKHLDEFVAAWELIMADLVSLHECKPPYEWWSAQRS